MEDDNQRLHWQSRHSMIHGRVVSLTIEATSFPQEQFLSEAVRILETGEPILLKVCGVLPGGNLRISTLGDNSLDQQIGG
jgi:hypothetical protein